MEVVYHYFKQIMIYFNRYRLINDRIDKEPYLERYYLFLRDRKNFPFNIFLHKFLKSDPDDLHDHPWGFVSIPIFPGYWEWTLEGKEWRGPFSLKTVSANYLHRVELDKNYNYCWSLFIPGPNERAWGFMTDSGWIEQEEYLYNKKNA